MIRIQVTCPFTYEYFNGDDKLVKRHYLTAGNYYHLEEEKDKEELRFILSPNFIFKNYIYVDLQTVPKELIEEFNLEYGFYEDNSVPEDEHIPTLLQNNKFVDASESYFHDDLISDPIPTKDPEVNFFDKTTVVEKEEEVLTEVKEEEKLGAENVPYLEPLETPSEEYVDVDTTDKEKELRKSELEEMHYSKVKEIAELYNIDYQNKKDTIQKILDLEFTN
jgi:hypothetical protein